MGSEGRFILKNKMSFRQMEEGTIIPESDLCFQDDYNIYQFQYHRPEENNNKFIIEPGTFTVAIENNAIVLAKSELRVSNLLTSVANTQNITNEANAFFSNLDVYKELEEPMARKILLYSSPGMGKSATISQYSVHALQEDPGTCIIVWPTNAIDADNMHSFMTVGSEYDEKVTRVILIMEDIGGNEVEGNRGPRHVDSGLLSILDGIELVFKVPTLIIATTNYPENLLSALADRPGRFDYILSLDPPSYNERVQLAEFIAKRPLSDDDKKAFDKKECEEFSIAHIKEVIIRSRLHKKSIRAVIDEVIAHRKRFNNGFEDKEEGFGFGR